MPKFYETIGVAIILTLLMGGGYFAYHGQGDTRDSFGVENYSESGQASDLDVNEKLFYQAVASGTSDEQIAVLQKDLNRLKKHEQRNYWLIVKLGKQFPESFKQGYELEDVFSFGSLLPALNTEGSVSENIAKVLGEDLSQKQGLFWEDKIVLLNRVYLPFKKEKLLKRLDSPTEFDRNFLEAHPDFFWDCLTELNGWLKGTEVVLAFKDEAQKKSRFELRNLLQRLYYLEVYLRYLKAEEPDYWQKLVSEKGVVFMLQRLFYLANQTAEAGRKSKIFKEYQLAFKRATDWKNRDVVNQLVSEAGIGKFKTLLLSDAKLREKGIAIELRDF